MRGVTRCCAVCGAVDRLAELDDDREIAVRHGLTL
jgi:hypothetical protein